jgi:hypothetical protein
MLSSEWRLSIVLCCLAISLSAFATASITYTTSLVLPPTDIDYNYYAATTFTTPNGNGVAVVGRFNTTGQVFAIVYEYVSPGGYAMRQQIPLEGPVGLEMTSMDLNEQTTVRLSDDLNRLVIMPTSGTSAVSFNTTAMAFAFNGSTAEYELVQEIPFANVRAFDMTRDGLTLVISANDTNLFQYKLDSTNTTTQGAQYLLMQDIEIFGHAAMVTLDAYGRVFAATIENEIYMFRVLEGNAYGSFGVQQILNVGVYLRGIKLSGNGTRLFITAFDITYPDGVFSARYNTLSQVWSSPAYTNVSSEGAAISTSDDGDALLVVGQASGRYELYSCSQLSDECTLNATLPLLPWESSTLATDDYGPSNLYSLTANCQQILSGHFTLDSYDPPMGNGQPVIYTTQLNCSITPILAPFTPPIIPPPVSPVAPASPIPVPLAPLAPIASPPRSPSIAPNYAPPTASAPTDSPSPSTAPEEDRTLAKVSLAISVILAALVIAYIIYSIATGVRSNGYSKMKDVK